MLKYLLPFSILLASCMSHQPLTLDDKFEEELDVDLKAGTSQVHMASAFKSIKQDKIIFDHYDYFHSQPWKSQNPNTIKLQFGEEGTEVVLNGASHDCIEYQFHHTDLKKHPILGIQISCSNDSTATIYDLKVGFSDAKTTLFHPSSFYIPQEKTSNWYYFDFRDLQLQHPHFPWKKIHRMQGCVQSKEGESAIGSFIISSILLKEATFLYSTSKKNF